MLRFSVIVPIYNEEDSIRRLYYSLKNVMDRIGQSYEIIFINDGSDDSSCEVLDSIELKSANLVVINLNKRSGQSAAMQAGFDIAQGELIITMDGDLQNDPEDIPGLLDKLEAGYDVVCGWRYDRKDSWRQIVSSKVANIIRKIFTEEPVHDVGCTLRIFKKEVLQNVYLTGGLHRFFTLIVSKLGYKIGELKVRHHHRKFGKTKYNIPDRLQEGIIDLIRISLCDIHKLMRRKSSYEIKEVIRK